MCKCNICGREDIPDYEMEVFEHQYEYWSKRDTDLLSIVACPDCMEKLTIMLINECKYGNPIKEYTGDPDNPYGDKVPEPEGEIIFYGRL